MSTFFNKDNLVLYKGKQVTSISLAESKRLINYGDGCFETIRVWENKPLWPELHLERLKSACKFLGIPFNQEETKSSVHDAISFSGFKSARLRLTAFRKAEGYYKTENIEGDLLVEINSLPHELYQLNSKSAGISVNAIKPLHPLFSVKTCNCLLYIQAAREAVEKGWEEIILLNEKGRVAEATSSNLFYFKGRLLVTPEAGEGMIPGIIRKKIKEICNSIHIELIEKKVDLKELAEADEIFLTNAVSGITSIQNLNQKVYSAEKTTWLSGLLREAAVKSVQAGI